MPLYEQKQRTFIPLYEVCTHISTSYVYTFDNIHHSSLFECITYTNPSGRTKDIGFSGPFIVNHCRFCLTI